MSHHCHAEGCTRPIPPRLFCCAPHWKMVPTWLQRLLYAVYVPGQEDTKEVTRIYLLVQSRCRIAIAEKEGKSIANPIRLIRELAATSEASGKPDSLHGKIHGKSDDVAIGVLDEGLPELVEKYVFRRREKARAAAGEMSLPFGKSP